jgi:hypothetical protein
VEQQVTTKASKNSTSSSRSAPPTKFCVEFFEILRLWRSRILGARAENSWGIIRKELENSQKFCAWVLPILNSPITKRRRPAVVEKLAFHLPSE